MNQNTIKEYDILRNEIIQKIELHNTLLTFTITTTVAVLALALAQKSSILYLIPYCILIPMSMRIAYYRTAMSKLSAYMIVFLEKNIDGIKWETRNARLISIESRRRIKGLRNFTMLRYYECLILAIACYVLYFWDYIKDKTISPLVVINALWPMLFVVLELLITKHINSIDNKKDYWIQRWTKILDEEKRD